MPLSAVVGKSEFMKIFDDVFFSTTYASDTLSLAAAKATIMEINEKPVIKRIWENGSQLMEEFNKITKENSLDIELLGYPVRMKIIGKDSQGNDSILLRSLLIQELVKRGIFMHPGVAFISYSHTKEDIKLTLNALSDSIPTIKKAVVEDKLMSYLNGKPSKPVYTIIKPSIKKPD